MAGGFGVWGLEAWGRRLRSLEFGGPSAPTDKTPPREPPKFRKQTRLLQLFTKIHPQTLSPNIGALITRIGFWGPLHYTYHKEPPPKKEWWYLFRPL